MERRNSSVSAQMSDMGMAVEIACHVKADDGILLVQVDVLDLVCVVW